MHYNRKSAIHGIGMRLRNALAFSGKSLREFSESAGIPYRTLQDYVADKRKPGADHLLRIAESGIDVQWLLTGKTYPLLNLVGFDLAKDDVVGAAPDLIRSLLEQAVANADRYSERRRARGESALTASQTLAVVSYYTAMVLKMAVKMSSQLGELKRAGADEKLVADMLTPPALIDLDPKIDELVRSAR